LRIIYIHQHFVTSRGTSGTRSYDVSKHLLEMGHKVTIVCGIHEQSGLPRTSRWKPFQTLDIAGIKVVVCAAYYSNKQTVPARLWSFVKFALLATLACVKERSADLIFATSTPLTVGIPARLGAAIKRIPYVFEVRDLWPEDLIAAGRMKPGLQSKVWEWLESFSYRKAGKILLVSKGFQDRLLERGLPPEKLKTILLGADARYYADARPDTEFLARHGLAGKTIAVYAGAHGDANGLIQVIDAAEHLRGRPDVAILLIGDGKVKPQLQAALAQRNLENVHMLDPVPKQELPEVLLGCHIGLMILKQIVRPRWVTPNKIFDYMFAGLPTIVNFPGTTAEFVEEEGVGVSSEPGSAEDLAAKIRYFADHPQERDAIARHARRIALKKYDRKVIAGQLADVFGECVGRQM
jgi:glycosyltransferase involved in cell wall biosynthesis